jgi:hypothetical protein
MNVFLTHPGLQELMVYASLWAILCLGICLPLITLKLYWKAILNLFPKEPAYHEFDRNRGARPGKGTNKP